jgi:hypothetical protein
MGRTVVCDLHGDGRCEQFHILPPPELPGYGSQMHHRAGPALSRWHGQLVMDSMLDRQPRFLGVRRLRRYPWGSASTWLAVICVTGGPGSPQKR